MRNPVAQQVAFRRPYGGPIGPDKRFTVKRSRQMARKLIQGEVVRSPQDD